MNEIETAVQQRLDNLIKPRGALGKIEGLVRRYATLRGTADADKLMQNSSTGELETYFTEHPEDYQKVFGEKKMILLSGVSEEQKLEYNLSLLQAGLKCYKEMWTFAEAGIEV